MACSHREFEVPPGRGPLMIRLYYISLVTSLSLKCIYIYIHNYLYIYFIYIYIYVYIHTYAYVCSSIQKWSILGPSCLGPKLDHFWIAF